ncbi:MAG: nickel pincer cofactor biosynthesis protein LarB [Opitutus sp.]|nr:nickel pincer cofactor biosynthesis protein LarB [Opitutus sp.]
MHDIDLDFSRDERIGLPELVYGESKSAAQLHEIAARYAAQNANLLVTRCRPEQIEGLDGDYDPIARTFLKLRVAPPRIGGPVGVIYAGTSDAPVAREALVTLRYLGIDAVEFGDCGVAGLHRLLAHRAEIEKCRLLICLAGFEGALPSVVGGLFRQPLIAVPTSVGYGVADGGRAALHAMLASCASGLVVVNIDNGCGAAMAARRWLNSCA